MARQRLFQERREDFHRAERRGRGTMTSNRVREPVRTELFAFARFVGMAPSIV